MESGSIAKWLKREGDQVRAPPASMSRFRQRC
jgi:hypothetical protein